jgi:hypothetical protein
MESKWTEMEEPCTCDCGEPFDLQDGYPSLHSKVVVCYDCHKREQDEADKKEEIEQEIETIGNASMDIEYSIKRLSELGYKHTSEVESFRSRVLAELKRMNPEISHKRMLQERRKVLIEVIEMVENLK